MLNFLLGIGEWIGGALIGLFTLPLLALGFIAGMRGGLRYFKLKSM